MYRKIKGENMKDIDTIFKPLDSLKSDLDKARKKYLAAANKKMNTIFQKLFDAVPELNGLVIRGYTPGFLDGETPYHMQDTMITRDDFNDYGEYEDESELMPFDNSRLDEKIVKKLHTKLESLREAFEDAYETNWELTITREKDGKVSFFHDDYDCGY